MEDIIHSDNSVSCFQNSRISDDMDLLVVKTFPQDQQVLESAIENKVKTLSLNSNLHQRTDGKWLCNLDWNSFTGCLMLNPECQIKILEENLNLLSSKNTKYNDQINSNICNYKLKMTPFSETHHNNIYDYNLFESSLLLKDKKAFSKGNPKNTHLVSSVTKLNPDSSDTQERKSSPLVDDLSINTPVTKSEHSSNFHSLKNKQNTFPIVREESCTNSLNIIKGRPIYPPDNSWDADDEIDNRFEFTIKQENIVSFVCNQSSPRIEIPKSRPLVNDNNKSCSDTEPGKETKLCKGDPWSKTLTNLSNKCSEKVENSLIDDTNVYLPTVNNNPCQSSLSTTHRSCIPMMGEQSPIYYPCRCSLGVQLDYTNRLSNDEKLSHETILFREASLRGCYNIENIVKGTKPALSEVESEINDVKELIFSAIGLKKNNMYLIKDSVLSILDIFKSWIKLNSYFEQKDFKDVLTIHGVDLSLLNDYLQWQRVSRVFIDKMILVLGKVSSQYTIFSDNYDTRYDHEPKLLTQNLKISEDLDEPRINFKSLTSSCINLIEELKMLQVYVNITPVNCKAHNKYWKKKRYVTEKTQTKELGGKNKRLLKSKFTINSSCNVTNDQFPKLFENTLHGFQNKKIPSSTDQINFRRLDQKLMNECDQTKQNDVNLFQESNHSAQHKFIKGDTHSQNIYLNDPLASFKPSCSFNSEIAYPSPNLKSLSTNSLSTGYNIPVNNHSAVKIQNFAPVPPNFVTQFFFENANEIQCNLSNNLGTPNPIYCVDTDLCMENTYIKPGSYNPPQKQATLQRAFKNSILIDDSPVIGICFHYSTPQIIPSISFQNAGNKEMIKEIDCVQTSEYKYKDSLISANNVGDNSVADMFEETSDFNLSESLLANSHSLLDEAGCHGSITNHKKDSGAGEESNFNKQTLAESISKGKSKLNMNNWLCNLFSNTFDSSGKDTEDNSNIDNSHSFLSGQESLEEARKSCDKNNMDQPNISIPSNHLEHKFDGCVDTNCLEIAPNESYLITDNQNEVKEKLLRKTKRVKQYCIATTGQTTSPPMQKQKTTYKRIVTKQVSYKLQHISHCIWNTDLSSLIENLESEKEASILDQKIRGSLYFHAMKSKLTDNSYDTLEQALYDFELNFADIKNKNKGDKQCIEVVAALEKMFMVLVEEHFGISYQQYSPFMQYVDVYSSLKPRKQKKTQRS